MWRSDQPPELQPQVVVILGQKEAMSQFHSEVLCMCSLYQVQCPDFFELCQKKLYVLNTKEQQKTSPAFFLSTSLPPNFRFFLLDLRLRIGNFSYFNDLKTVFAN